ncbi:MAG: HlyD family efflux transporter periplasmic adaptor subunit [Chlamydiota bacterium]
MADENAENQNKELSKRRKKLFVFTTLCFLLIGFAVYLYWLFVWRFEEYTNDAYVSGNMVELTPQVPGIVAAIYADNTDYVEAGQLIIALDRTDYALAFEKSMADLAETVRRVSEMFIAVKQLEADVEARQADVVRAEQDFANRVDLVSIGGVAKEEFEHTETNLLRAQADLMAARFALEKSYAQVGKTTVRDHPLVQKAAEVTRTAWVDLKRCDIIAPVTGYIAMRSAQLGEWVEQSQPLLAIVPLNELWVDANFKETKLSKMRVGQQTRLTSDIYGHSVVFHGKVIGINPGTGNVFSALPPQNATGNWIKIVQRVPVRISLSPKELQKHPLWLGLSMNVHVDVSDEQGEMLVENVQRRPIYATDLYALQQEGIDLMIEEVITTNATVP